VTTTPQALLSERHPAYKEAGNPAPGRRGRLTRAQKRVEELERKLAQAQDGNRRRRARTALEKAKEERTVAEYEVERTGQALDRLPSERKSEWLRQAQRDFQDARSDYEQQIGLLAAARERLAEEAQVVSFLLGGPPVYLEEAHRPRTHKRRRGTFPRSRR
jgi:predicted  nucleic acid-binding Zn-ribbon protein